MQKYNFTWFLLFTLILCKSIKARPISYVGGWTIMQMNDFKNHSIHLHYSPSIKYSIGYRGEYWREKEWQFHGTQLNYLIKRLNTSTSQSNFYLKSGLGLAFTDFKQYEKKIETALFSGLAFDWENRQYYISYENKFNYNAKIDEIFIQKSRIGFAPYVGSYGDLHTWLILQVENIPKANKKIVFTPMIRIFKGDYLAETGLSNNKDFMFNFIKRF